MFPPYVSITAHNNCCTHNQIRTSKEGTARILANLALLIISPSLFSAIQLFVWLVCRLCDQTHSSPIFAATSNFLLWTNCANLCEEAQLFQKD